MFNFSKRTSKDIFDSLPTIKKMLKNADLYLAHKPKNIPKDEETLNTHIELVIHYTKKLIESHGIDTAMDALISDLVRLNFTEDNFEAAFHWLKTLFCKGILYHDHGKVNENFQALPNKMDNSQSGFKITSNSPIESGHSKLGTYLFLVEQFSLINDTPFQGSEKRFLYEFVIAIGYNISKHHAPYISNSWDIRDDLRHEEVEFMVKYLNNYNANWNVVFENPIGFILKRYEKRKPNSNYPFFALIKLHFSLLTASDYLATHEYMNLPKGETMSDFGVLSNKQKEDIYENIYNKVSYNKSVFKNLELGITPSVSEADKPKDQLNTLRQRMATEAVRNARIHAKERLFYIEAPTGGGKTNVSLLVTAELLKWNAELNKVFYVFPFTTLITQTHKVILDSFGLDEKHIAELHSKSGLKETTKAEEDEESEDGKYGDEKADYIANLFGNYPITLLSHVRFFDILKSNGKEKNYWLHRLANAVVVIDEVQAYPPKIWDRMAYLLSEYARYFNMRIIVMSATLPKIDELLTENLYNDKVPKPNFISLIPDAKQYFQNPIFSKRVKFRFNLLDEPLFEPNNKDTTEEDKKEKLQVLAKKLLLESEETAKRVEEHRNGGVFTIIEFIFKKTASQFAKVIKEEMDTENPFFHEVFVLSGTILEHRRRYIIDFLKNDENKEKRVLLITTQVVEAGVDIDMDLGFKDTSLIDSDEQLAGRINRNVSKLGCEMFLFNLDKQDMLYKEDERYKAVKDKTITLKEHRQILEDKDFNCLYYKTVFNKLIDRNKSDKIKNFDDYLNYLQNLDFKEADRNFKIIDQQNVSVFVPIDIDKSMFEPDLEYLKWHKMYNEGDPSVSGKKVFAFYKSLVQTKKERQKTDFVQTRIDFKKLGGIMSKFCFSIMAHSKDAKELPVTFAIEEYGFIYLTNHKEVYSIDEGINAKKYDDSNFFLNVS